MTELPAHDPHRLTEHDGYEELAAREIRISVAARDLEVFGLLLGERLSALGSGHSERDGDAGRLMVATSEDGWVATLVVHGIASARIERVTARVLVPPESKLRDASSQLASLERLVRSAAKDARDQVLRSYTWRSTLAPRGRDNNLVTRARLRLAGRYKWSDVSLDPLAKPYEGSEPMGWGVSRPYVEHGFVVTGTVQGLTGFLGQRESDRAVHRLSVFLSLLFRTAIEPRQQVASIVEGDRSDLTRLFGEPEVTNAEGIYSTPMEAFAQAAADQPEEESTLTFAVPEDAVFLWQGLSDRRDDVGERAWSALAAYKTAWQLYLSHPTLSFVSLVTSVEALVDSGSLERCAECRSLKGVSAAYRHMIVRHTGVPDTAIKKFTDLTYDRRSDNVHAGALFGGEGESALGPRWVVPESWWFAVRDWQDLEALTAATLLGWLREQSGAPGAARGQQDAPRSSEAGGLGPGSEG